MSLFMRLVLLLFCGYSLSLSVLKPECTDEFHLMGQCMSDSGLENLWDPRHWHEKLATDVDGCFSSLGCHKIMNYGCNDVCSTGAGSASDKMCKCMNKVNEKLQIEFSYKTCMENKDPDYKCTCSDKHNETANSNQCSLSPPRNASLDFLVSSCDGNVNKAKELGACINGARDRNKPSKDVVKADYEGICNAQRQCKPKLGKKCEDKMIKWQQYMCECDQEYYAKAKALHDNEPACANVYKPPEFGYSQDCKNTKNLCDTTSFEEYYNGM